eukprot:m51a1_g7459 hypothetical protein (1451) ;mRNA; r:141028-145822
MIPQPRAQQDCSAPPDAAAYAQQQQQQQTASSSSSSSAQQPPPPSSAPSWSSSALPNTFRLAATAEVRAEVLAPPEAARGAGGSDAVLRAFRALLDAGVACMWRRHRPPIPAPLSQLQQLQQLTSSAAAPTSAPTTTPAPARPSSRATVAALHQRLTAGGLQQQQQHAGAQQRGAGRGGVRAKELVAFYWGDEHRARARERVQELAALEVCSTGPLDERAAPTFFCALRNLLERGMHRSGFVRLGTSFVRCIPPAMRPSLEAQDRSSVCVALASFLSGGSVWVHAAVHRRHIHAASADCTPGTSVLVATNGDAGTLRGPAEPDATGDLERAWDDWHGLRSPRPSAAPALRVSIDGVSLRFPAGLVFALQAPEAQQQQQPRQLRLLAANGITDAGFQALLYAAVCEADAQGSAQYGTQQLGCGYAGSPQGGGATPLMSPPGASGAYQRRGQAGVGTPPPGPPTGSMTALQAALLQQQQQQHVQMMAAHQAQTLAQQQQQQSYPNPQTAPAQLLYTSQVLAASSPVVYGARTPLALPGAAVPAAAAPTPTLRPQLEQLENEDAGLGDEDFQDLFAHMDGGAGRAGGQDGQMRAGDDGDAAAAPLSPPMVVVNPPTFFSLHRPSVRAVPNVLPRYRGSGSALLLTHGASHRGPMPSRAPLPNGAIGTLYPAQLQQPQSQQQQRVCTPAHKAAATLGSSPTQQPDRTGSSASHQAAPPRKRQRVVDDYDSSSSETEDATPAPPPAQLQLQFAGTPSSEQHAVSTPAQLRARPEGGVGVGSGGGGAELVEDVLRLEETQRSAALALLHAQEAAPPMNGPRPCCCPHCCFCTTLSCAGVPEPAAPVDALVRDELALLATDPAFELDDLCAQPSARPAGACACGYVASAQDPGDACPLELSRSVLSELRSTVLEFAAPGGGAGVEMVRPLREHVGSAQGFDAVEELAAPPVVVGQCGAWLEADASWLHLWEKSQLEPFAPRKNVRYYAVAGSQRLPGTAPGMAEYTVQSLLRDLSAVYEACNLGRHRPVDAALRVVSDADYARAAREVAESLRPTARVYQENLCVVVYLVLPAASLSTEASVVTTARFDIALRSALAAGAPRGEWWSLVVQPVSLGPSGNVPSCSALRDLALCVYSRLRRYSPPNAGGLPPRPPQGQQQAQAQAQGQQQQWLLYEPAVALAPSWTRQWQGRPAHVCYAMSPGARWIVSAITDSAGELLEVQAVQLAPPVQSLEGLVRASVAEWYRSLRALVPGQLPEVVVTRLGAVPRREFEALKGTEASSAALCSLRVVPESQLLFASSAQGQQPRTLAYAVGQTCAYEADLWCAPALCSLFVTTETGPQPPPGPPCSSSSPPVAATLTYKVALHKQSLLCAAPPAEQLRAVARQLHGLSFAGTSASALGPRRAALPFHVDVVQRMLRLVQLAPAMAAGAGSMAQQQQQQQQQQALGGQLGDHRTS